MAKKKEKPERNHLIRKGAALKNIEKARAAA